MATAIVNAAQRKLEVIRNRLQREIERLGIGITVHRQTYKSDGSNGYIPNGEITFRVKGIMKSLSANQARDFTPTDGGKTYTITETLSVLYDSSIDFKMYDWFVHGDIKYTILQVSDVGEQHVYWLLSMSMEPQEVERYGK